MHFQPIWGNPEHTALLMTLKTWIQKIRTRATLLTISVCGDSSDSTPKQLCPGVLFFFLSLKISKVAPHRTLLWVPNKAPPALCCPLCHLFVNPVKVDPHPESGEGLREALLQGQIPEQPELGACLSDKEVFHLGVHTVNFNKHPRFYTATHR